MSTTCLLAAGSGGIVGWSSAWSAAAARSLPCRSWSTSSAWHLAHVAIGTSAIAVRPAPSATCSRTGASATSSGAARPCSQRPACSGAFAGSAVAKALDGQKLLALFGLVMVVVGIVMLRGAAPAATRTSA